MHLRGKSSKIILHYPDGTQETVFDLPRYRFSWQRYYYLAEPLSVPKGTIAEFIGVWDNSEANPLNPNPTVWCGWGWKTTARRPNRPESAHPRPRNRRDGTRRRRACDDGAGSGREAATRGPSRPCALDSGKSRRHSFAMSVSPTEFTRVPTP